MTVEIFKISARQDLMYIRQYIHGKKLYEIAQTKQCRGINMELWSVLWQKWHMTKFWSYMVCQVSDWCCFYLTLWQLLHIRPTCRTQLSWNTHKCGTVRLPRRRFPNETKEAKNRKGKVYHWKKIRWMFLHCQLYLNTTLTLTG